MKKEAFLAALEIISGHHTTELAINKPMSDFVGDLGKSEFTIHITKSCATVVDKLVKAGYSLFMDKHGLNVHRYK
jgi:hypothetical protein